MRKVILFCLSALLFLSDLQAQWTQRTSLNGAARGGAVSWVINDKLYIAGGAPGQSLQEYNPATNTWNTLAPPPWTTARYLGVGFVIEDKGYICTGTDGVNGIYYNELWMYDPVADAWSAKASFPGAARVLGFAFSIGEKAYVGAGGDNFLFYKDMFEYDSVTDSWVAKSNYPGGLSVQQVATSFNGLGYVGGGVEFVPSSNNFFNRTELYSYTPATDTWTLVTNIPGPGRLSGVAFASPDLIYVGLGTDSQSIGFGSIYKDFYTYDPVNSDWDTLANMPFGRAYATGGFLKGKPYVATGGNNSTTFSDLWTFMFNAVDMSENFVNLNYQFFPTLIDKEATFSVNNESQFTIKISDLEGKEQLVKKGLVGSSKIDFSRLANGCYIVTIEGERTVKQQKIMVMH